MDQPILRAGKKCWGGRAVLFFHIIVYSLKKIGGSGNSAGGVGLVLCLKSISVEGMPKSHLRVASPLESAAFQYSTRKNSPTHLKQTLNLYGNPKKCIFRRTKKILSYVPWDY